jgi:phosphoenolpyruvate carboxykinase (GTP)
MKPNPNAMLTVERNSLYTNTALTEDGRPWWEGIGYDPPGRLTDWQGNFPWDPSKGKAAHPNSRFTAPARQCPSISAHWEDPQGVPISAILFGGRRARVAPLIYESFDWNHGVFVGASAASETTAAATGQVGVVRRDPMAMLPFCGYNMGDYFGHWIRMGTRSPQMPRIFHVNWFRQGADGRFLWPGYGENLRALLWVLDRCRGAGKAQETPIGLVPAPGALDTEGLDVDPETIRQLLAVDRDDWRGEVASQKEFFGKFGDRMPREMWNQLEGLEKRLQS